MAELPHPWGTYVQLQDNLRGNYRVGDQSWGTEAGMDHILECVATAKPPEDDLGRIIATTRRRERVRTSRRDDLPQDGFPSQHPENSLIARDQLQAISRRVGPHNWSVLEAVGSGRGYKEISATVSTTAGAIRVKVMRLRALIAKAA